MCKPGENLHIFRPCKHRLTTSYDLCSTECRKVSFFVVFPSNCPIYYGFQQWSILDGVESRTILRLNRDDVILLSHPSNNSIRRKHGKYRSVTKAYAGGGKGGFYIRAGKEFTQHGKKYEKIWLSTNEHHNFVKF